MTIPVSESFCWLFTIIISDPIRVYSKNHQDHSYERMVEAKLFDRPENG